MKAYAEEYQETLSRLGTDSNDGLTDEKVEQNREKYGSNQVEVKKKKSLLHKIVENMKEPMVIILLVAAFITTGVNVLKYFNGYETEFIECIGIIAAIILTIAITMIMEGRSEKAFELLNQMKEDIQVKVIRDGLVQKLNQRELVVGDLLLVGTGDKLVADGRLVEEHDLQVDESMLTGESHLIHKTVKVCSKETEIAERTNMLYSGSFVTGGSGKMVVTEVGTKTEFGKIAESLTKDQESKTPLQEKLKQLGGKIAVLGASIAVITFILQIIAMGGNYTLENILEAFISSIVLIVAAVPEGLSTIVAASLAINVIKLAKENTLVKKMVACETIGSINIICSDKTGTLTENKMKVIAIESVDSKSTELNHYLIQNICINSTADLGTEKERLQDFIGNPTEGALLFELNRQGIEYRKVRSDSNVIDVQPFSSEMKKMTTTIKEQDTIIILTKGSPEKILEICELDEIKKQQIEEQMKAYQRKACRLIAFCHKQITSDMLEESGNLLKDYENDCEEMVYDGFCAIADSLRKETFAAVNQCKEAGIEIKMLTGDNRITAMAIAQELEILQMKDLVVEAKELEDLGDEQFEEILPRIRVIARSTPLIKMRVVNTLKKLGNVVAVTGDGINDAPALKHADIGVAMGKAGTEVSKEASDMILLDDSFSTIVRAVEWGRGLYDNFQRFIQFQLTVNVSSVLVILGTLILGFKAPFTPLQLLWINVIMDGPPALTLGLEPIQSGLMKRKPTSRKASIVTKSMMRRILRNGIVITLICLLQKSLNFLNGLEVQQASILFTLFMVCQLFNAFNSRKLRGESIRNYGLKNKKMLLVMALTFGLQVVITQFGGSLFNTAPLSLMIWLKILGIGLMVVVLDEIMVWIERKLDLEI